MVDTDQHIRRGLSGPFEYGRGTLAGALAGCGALVRCGCLVRVSWCPGAARVPGAGTLVRSGCPGSFAPCNHP